MSSTTVITLMCFVIFQRGDRPRGRTLLADLAPRSESLRELTAPPSGAPVQAGLVVSVSYARDLAAFTATLVCVAAGQQNHDARWPYGSLYGHGHESSREARVNFVVLSRRAASDNSLLRVHRGTPPPANILT